MPREALYGSMSDTLTPREAAGLLQNAATYERALERRAEGLTMMTWGLVNSALFVFYGFLDLLDAPAWAFATGWLPWVLVGLLMTFALWRSAALSRARPLVDEPTGGFWLRAVGLTLAIALVFSLVRPDGPALPLAILGAVYAAVAALNLFRSHAEERRLAFGAGLALLALGAGLGLASAPIELAGSVAIAAPLAILGGLGLWQTLRG
jgi:hypothetical protein